MIIPPPFKMNCFVVFAIGHFFDIIQRLFYGRKVPAQILTFAAQTKVGVPKYFESEWGFHIWVSPFFSDNRCRYGKRL